MKIGQFILSSDGRIGIITTEPTHVNNPRILGGIRDSSCDLWFGKVVDGRPVLERLLIRSDWQIWTCLESDVEILVNRNQHGTGE